MWKKLLRRFITVSRGERCKAVKSRINRGNIIAQKFHRSLGFTEAETYEYFLDFETDTENRKTRKGLTGDLILKFFAEKTL